MRTPIFEGVATALVTPMRSDGQVHYKAMGQLVDYQLSHHADGLVVAGTTGEASTLSKEEYEKLLKQVVKQAEGRVPVIAGAGSNCTKSAVETAKRAWQCGANALLCVTPYYNKTSQKGLAAHFIAIADATPLPVILYNVPSRTGLNLLPETCQLLCSHPHIRGLKEAGTSLHQAQKTLLLCKDKLDLYSGNDDLLLPFLSIGAKGVISVVSNLLPQTFHDICVLFRQGKTEESRRMMEEYWELTEALFSDVNPIPIKQALNWAGLSAGFCRAPLCPMEPKAKNRLRQAMKSTGLLSSLPFSGKKKSLSAPTGKEDRKVEQA